MVKYLDFHAPTGDVDVTPSLTSPAVSGANIVPLTPASTFRPWQPSTWPKPPAKVNKAFIEELRKIFCESMLEEISNVIKDSTQANGDLQHRGHVVGISLMCALDALSSYGYRGKHVARFVGNHFPPDYQPHADNIYGLYRNSLVHNWNLFQATILPGNDAITQTRRGGLSFGLLNFFDALKFGLEDFLKKLETDPRLQTQTLDRYRKLRSTARS